MEALPSLPPELLALAAPMAREPAPLLGFGGPEPEHEGAALPFDLYLALMTAPRATGEAWPASGKDLPVAVPVAGPSAPQTPPPATAAPDALLLARFGLADFEAGAQTLSSDLLPAQTADALPQGAQQPASSVEDAVLPTQPVAADVADFVPTDAGDASTPELAQLMASATPAEGAEAGDMLEQAAPDARALRLQPLAGERPLVPPSHARSALGAADGRPVEATSRDDTPMIEVTKVSQTVLPAVAEAAGATAEWLPAAHTTTTASAHAPAQPAAAANAPVDMRTPDWQEAFANRVQWLAGRNGGEARITLNPPELGAVDVKVSLVEDKTYVQMTAATTAARDELAQHLPRLRELFAASGIDLGGASVHDGREGNYPGAGGERSQTPEPRRPAPFADLADEPPVPHSAPRSLGRIDLFA